MEDEIIKIFTEEVPIFNGGSIPYGDDAIQLLAEKEGLIVTHDTLLEGIHFDSSQHDLADIGFKSVAVNISDLAAKAALPQYIFAGIVLPRKWSLVQVRQLAKGMGEACRNFGVAFAGGDTNTWDQGLVLGVTAMGQPHSRYIPLRSAAQDQDWLLVSGPLGGSLSGRHLRPQPRIALARRLVDSYQIHAMMDLSDGLSTDLRRMCQSAHLGARLFAEWIPIHQDCDTSTVDGGLKQALHDGEDFELLFTAKEAVAKQILADTAFRGQCFRIGQMEKGQRILIVHEGREELLREEGYLHSLESRGT